jgi:hypothetical protein
MGYKNNEIKQKLSEEGWSKKVIDDALSKRRK